MPLPWLQIVQLVPSLVEVSRELLKKTRRSPPATAGSDPHGADEGTALAARIAVLEENERRQAELVNQMAEQIAGVTRAMTDLQHRQLWLILATAGSLCLAIAALVMTGAEQL